MKHTVRTWIHRLCALLSLGIIGVHPVGASAGARPPLPRIASVRAGDLYLRQPDGNEARLTADGGVSAPWWTTDGAAIFFTRTTGDASAASLETWRWRADTGPERVPSGVWSPDGAAVASAEGVPQSEANVPGGALIVERGGERLALAPATPDVRWQPLAWSPDGTRLAFARLTITETPVPGAGVRPWVTDATIQITGNPLDGPTTTLAVPQDPLWTRGAMHAASRPDRALWSPDGRFLLVSIGPGDNCGSCLADGLPLYILPVNGGPAVPLEETLQTGAFAWGSTGGWAVLSGPQGRETYVQKHLARFDAVSGARRDLTTDPRWADTAPAVSPDGRRIAFARGETTDTQQSPLAAIATRRLWLMDADGSNPQAVTNPAGWVDDAPVWTPDGARLLFVRWHGGKGTPSSAALWSVGADGTGAALVVANLDLPRAFGDGFGYYGSFGWSQMFAVAPG